MATEHPISNADRGLIAHGAVMTLLGLLSGFTPPFARAPRIALEAHNAGIIQGVMLFALAAVWPALGSSRPIVRVARWCALVGLYANWLGAQLAAFWSTSAMFSVNGASMPPGAAPWMESFVAVLLILSGLVIVTCVLILYSLREAPAATSL